MMRGQNQLLNQAFFWEWVFYCSKIFTSHDVELNSYYPAFLLTVNLAYAGASLQYSLSSPHP